MKKIILILFLFFVTGCNSYTELNDLGIIEKIAIEYKDSKYRLHASIINKLDNDTNIKNYQIIASNIPDLFDNLSLFLNKKIYLSHLNLLIINDSINTNNLKELINFFLNNNDTREDFLVVTTNNIDNLFNNLKWNEINDLVNINTKTGKSIYTTMFDIASNYYLDKPIYLTSISYDSYPEIIGFEKIYHNQKTFIDNDDTIFINYLLNNIEGFKINLKCTLDDYLYLEIKSSNTNIFSNKIFITNELKIINNQCNLPKDKINNLFNDYLSNNLSRFTKQKIIIKNTIRGIYENN